MSDQSELLARECRAWLDRVNPLVTGAGPRDSDVEQLVAFVHQAQKKVRDSLPTFCPRCGCALGEGAGGTTETE